MGEWEGFEVVLPDGGATVATQEGRECLDGGPIWATVQTIRCLECDPDGGWETLWDQEEDVVLVRSLALLVSREGGLR